MRSTGEWLSTVSVEHECRPPSGALVWVWTASIGARWQCECGEVWRLARRADDRAIMPGRTWVREQVPGRLQVFREADDDLIRYWLTEELGPLHFHFPAETVVTAMRKHFTIGVET